MMNKPSALRQQWSAALHRAARVATRLVRGTRGDHLNQPQPDNNDRATEARWRLPTRFTTTLPKASAPPSPYLPSEIKYSASLVQGQAVIHLVMGALLFVMGVLGSRHGSPLSTSAGVWCGAAATLCGGAGLAAHALWYKNWAIKVFLVAACCVIGLCLLGLAITFHCAITTASQHAAFAYYHGHYDATVAPNGTHISRHVFFEHPSSPPSKNLVGNIVMGLVVEVLLSVWSVVVALKGVRAEEFTTIRREEMVKETISRASTVSLKTETNGSMPLAALYNLLQTHPELLSSKLQWGSNHPRVTAASLASMDYQERVARYLSQNHQMGSHTERNSPVSATSIKKTSVSTSDTRDQSRSSQKRKKSRSKSEQRAKNIDQKISLKDRNQESQGYYSSDIPTGSRTSPHCQTDTPSSTLTRLDYAESHETLEISLQESEYTKQPQSLMLSLKTLSPLSSHVINPLEMIPGKAKKSKTKNRSKPPVEPASKADSFQTSDEEFNVSFTHTFSRPPPLPKKEFAKPKLVINKKLHEINIPGNDSNSRNSILPVKEIRKRDSCYDLSNTKRSEIGHSDFNKENLVICEIGGNSVVASVVGSVMIEVNDATKTTTLPKKRKDRRPPPVPDKYLYVSDLPQTHKNSQDMTNITLLQDNNKELDNINVKKYQNRSQNNKEHTNIDNTQAEHTTIPNNDRVMAVHKESEDKYNQSKMSESISIEIRPYENKTVVTDRYYSNISSNG